MFALVEQRNVFHGAGNELSKFGASKQASKQASREFARILDAAVGDRGVDHGLSAR
jgi:hypothetical protein